ncbi:hypothetical protein DFH07DRAFT_396830 [Mycena maculata]|uniref:V-type proton ATPase subunit a n=1 Tax=Mycena maculata TaxID=230809 RepID=A0AAD7NJN4_9AGAR|nr:hypothetical protein DFH07DRAFT_396830 [Mycena maculata]
MSRLNWKPMACTATCQRQRRPVPQSHLIILSRALASCVELTPRRGDGEWPHVPGTRLASSTTMRMSVVLRVIHVRVSSYRVLTYPSNRALPPNPSHLCLRLCGEAVRERSGVCRAVMAGAEATRTTRCSARRRPRRGWAQWRPGRTKRSISTTSARMRSSTASAVSHTTSYLRLLALSLTHAQLSEVHWDMTIAGFLGPTSVFGWIALLLLGLGVTSSGLTMGILCLVEGLSAWIAFDSLFRNSEMRWSTVGARLQPIE